MLSYLRFRGLGLLTFGFAWLSAGAAVGSADERATWMADNGNGTFTNPLFYDEFSDPDMIRVGEDYYLTGTTMHTMPGLPVLHSRDLVNWRFLSYACERLDLGPEYRLEGGEIYGQGIWAPSFRYHQGTFYIFTNVNGRHTQVFTAKNPAGPWTHAEMRCSLHDLSVLFDDDGRIFAIWGYNEIRMAELLPDVSDIKPGTERVLIAAGSGMGEGSHFYKIDGRYYIVSAHYDPVGRMVCARSDRPEGPYEIAVISARETLGIEVGWKVSELGRGKTIRLERSRPNQMGAIALHQGGIIATPSGEWWGYSMMDHNSIGRLTCLSPVTWQDGWPYFGLAGNLTRTPRTWLKPKTAHNGPPTAPYQRNDDFSATALQPIWQWNHAPDNSHWSLAEQPGALRIHTQPADSFFHARNTLTQRAIGPESIACTELDASGLKPGDVAGLALLNVPYAWVGVVRTERGLAVRWFSQVNGQSADVPLEASRVTLRASCDFDREIARFSFSTDGTSYREIGEETVMAFQLKTFQGVRYALFAYNDAGAAGGWADFNSFRVDEPRAAAKAHAIPVGKVITLTSFGDQTRMVAWNGLLRPYGIDAAAAATPAARFRVHDRGLGRVALSAEDGSGFVTVRGIGASGDVRLMKTEAGEASLFQWQDMLRGDVMLLSVKNHRFLRVVPDAGEPVSADSPGTQPDRKDGSCFIWKEVL